MFSYLAQRCAAEAPSADLDAEIIQAVFGIAGALRPVTSSLDAAVTLVPKGFGWSITDRGTAFIHWPESSSRNEYVGGTTPALAMCEAAMLVRATLAADRALAEKEI